VTGYVPPVIVWALKPAEDGAGQGTIVRLWNVSQEPSSYRLKISTPVNACIRTTHIETDIQPMDVTDSTISESLAAGQMRTLRIVAGLGAAVKSGSPLRR
jgi:alpha-mannosidase